MASKAKYIHKIWKYCPPLDADSIVLAASERSRRHYIFFKTFPLVILTIISEISSLPGQMCLGGIHCGCAGDKIPVERRDCSCLSFFLSISPALAIHCLILSIISPMPCDTEDILARVPSETLRKRLPLKGSAPNTQRYPVCLLLLLTMLPHSNWVTLICHCLNILFKPQILIIIPMIMLNDD